jgi:hypothetical protein
MTRMLTRNGRRAASANPASIFAELGDFGGNLANLVGLQAELAAHDAREALGRATPALILTGFAVLVVPASAVLAMFGAGLALARAFGWADYAGLLVVAAIGLVLGVLGVLYAIRRYRVSVESFRRSADELRRNMAWIKTVVAQSGR